MKVTYFGPDSLREGLVAAASQIEADEVIISLGGQPGTPDYLVAYVYPGKSNFYRLDTSTLRDTVSLEKQAENLESKLLAWPSCKGRPLRDYYDWLKTPDKFSPP